MHPTATDPLSPNSFMALTNIAFSSVQRLTELNLQATRTAFDKGLSLPQLPTDAKAVQGAIKHLANSADGNIVAYMRDVQEIAADTQRQLVSLMTRYLQPGTLHLSDDWQNGFLTLRNFGQKFNTTVEENSKAVIDAAEKAPRSASATLRKSM